MSTNASSLSLPFNLFPRFVRRPSTPPPTPRRRSTPEQGMALEILGHAIEYLVDSRLYDEWESPADAAAVHLLMSCSREVFADCELVQPWHQRIQMLLLRRLHINNARSR